MHTQNCISIRKNAPTVSQVHVCAQTVTKLLKPSCGQRMSICCDRTNIPTINDSYIDLRYFFALTFLIFCET